jgi:hypothetical protein
VKLPYAKYYAFKVNGGVEVEVHTFLSQHFIQVNDHLHTPTALLVRNGVLMFVG